MNVSLPAAPSGAHARAIFRACWATILLCVLSALALGQARNSSPALASKSAADQPGVVDLAATREPITTLRTGWRFHAGDDVRWADPALDDGAWSLIDPAAGWSAQATGPASGYVWLRIHVRRSPATAQLLLEMPSLAKNYEVYADGQRVASIGFKRSGKAVNVPASRIFTLPSSLAPDAVTVLALRLQTPPQYAWYSPNSLPGPVRVGAPAALQPAFDRAKAWRLLERDGMNYTAAILQLPIFAAALLLLLLTRERFYLWFALEMIIGVCQFTTHIASAHFGWAFGTSLAVNIFWDFATGAVLAIFLAGYLGLPSLRLVYLAILTQGLAEVGPALVPFNLSALWANIIYFVFITISDGLLLWLIVRVWRRGVPGAGLFLIPYLLSIVVVELGNFGYILIELKVSGAERWIPSEMILLTHPFSITLLDVADIAALFGYLAVLVYRFARTSQEEQRLSAALQAAHEIQNRLLPTNLAQRGGLNTEVVYLAAEEVGGDFCQVLPRADGSVLAVIGDVSGKGVQAAMVGALAVGVLRSLVEEQAAPSLILERMNEVILRSGQPGFVTCLCMQICPGGSMTIANAGHLAPYINGVEVETEPGLPLGLVSGMQYARKVVQLPPRARLTMLSDGVVEARSRSGELFGFSRATEISGRTAKEIAAAAQQFGQEDDITVVTLNWNAAAA